jgi:hypothetical protein
VRVDVGHGQLAVEAAVEVELLEDGALGGGGEDEEAPALWGRRLALELRGLMRSGFNLH